MRDRCNTKFENATTISDVISNLFYFKYFMNDNSVTPNNRITYIYTYT